jgi:hypothetical protein
VATPRQRWLLDLPLQLLALKSRRLVAVAVRLVLLLQVLLLQVVRWRRWWRLVLRSSCTLASTAQSNRSIHPTTQCCCGCPNRQRRRRRRRLLLLQLLSRLLLRLVAVVEPTRQETA